VADRRLLEDGTSFRLLEDGTSFRLLETVKVSPTLLGGGTLFSPAFGLSVSPPLNAREGGGASLPLLFGQAGAESIFAPSIQTPVSPPLIGPSGVVFTPAPSQSIPIPVIGPSAALFAPIVEIASGMPLISGSQGGTSLPLLLGSASIPSSQALEPRVSAPSVKLPSPLGGHSIFTPTGFSIQSDPQTVSPTKLGGPIFDPAIFDPAIFDVGTAVFAPTVGQELAIAVTTLGGGTLFSPALSQALTVSVGIIDQTAVIFAPVVTATGVQVYPDLLGGHVLYAPGTTPGPISITLNRIDQAGVTFAPTLAVGGLTISPALIDRTAVLFGMSVLLGGVTVSPNVIGPSGVTFAPQFNLAGFSPPLISQAAVLFTPDITGGLIVITGTVPIALGTNLEPGAGNGTSHQPPVGAGSNLKPER
jgi:hypothetical protein